MNCWQFAIAVVAHAIQLRSGLDDWKRRITGVGIAIFSLPTTLFDRMVLPRVVRSLCILILIVAGTTSHIPLLIQTLLRLLRRSLLLSINLLRMVVIATLLIFVVVYAILQLINVIDLIVITTVTIATIFAHHAHFSIFRVALFEQRSLAIFLLILYIGNTMPLLRRAARQVLAELLFLNGYNLYVVIHPYRCLLKQLVVVVVILQILRIVINRQSLFTTRKTFPLIVRFQMVLISGG